MDIYLQIDPVSGEAINGFLIKGSNKDPLDCINWILVSGGAQVGWIWNSDKSEWSPPILPVVTIGEIREQRDQMLIDSDWRVSVSDYPNEDKDQWVAYRQLLRDFPDTYVPVESPSWPTQPNQ